MNFPTQDFLLTLPVTALAVAVVLGVTLIVALRGASTRWSTSPGVLDSR